MHEFVVCVYVCVYVYVCVVCLRTRECVGGRGEEEGYEGIHARVPLMCVCVVRARVCLYDKMHTFVVICKRRKRSGFSGDEAL